MASLFMRFPDGRAKALTLSYDDGVEQDIRLVDIMNRRGLKGTFNINSGLYTKQGTVFKQGTIHRRMSEEQVTSLFTGSGQEVALHALTHPYLEQLPAEMAAYEVVKDKENLEKQFNTIIRGMAYPFGTYSDNVVEILKNAGVAYARTTISTEDFRIPMDWLRLTATCHHNNSRLMELADKFVSVNPDRMPWLFYLWGHSYEFEANDNWQVIENFSALTGGRQDIWYATNIEIYEYIHAFLCIQSSTAGELLHNPSALKLWLTYADHAYSIGPGETIRLNK